MGRSISTTQKIDPRYGEEDLLVATQLTDLDGKPVETGMPVEMVTRRIRSDDEEKTTLPLPYTIMPHSL
ncbi:MAG: hypothetical protein M1281_01045 [Chloroflexi bacterium]|nr:hypothetical protein [Chloroflexota bacterium]